VARGQGGYTVYRDHHWALEGCDLYYGDVIGARVPLLGYENDGCRFVSTTTACRPPVPIPGRAGEPRDHRHGPGAFGEEEPLRPLIPPENSDHRGRDRLRRRQRPSPGAGAARPRGDGRLRRGAGEVFNAGTTEWAHGLAAGDPFVTRITRNVLKLRRRWNRLRQGCRRRLRAE
jgi:hypothetical protein